MNEPVKKPEEVLAFERELAAFIVFVRAKLSLSDYQIQLYMEDQLVNLGVRLESR